MIPQKIDDCPIIDAVVEIRFVTKLYPNAVFGIIYNAFQEEFSAVEKLPILQIPDQLLDTDPNFKFKPHYKISNEKLSVQVGPDVIVIGSSMPYKGWEDYSLQIYNFYNKLFKLGVITKVIRVGLRYINFFESDIFQNIKLSLKIGNNEHECINTVIRTVIKENGFINTIQIANDVQNFHNESSTGNSKSP